MVEIVVAAPEPDEGFSTPSALAVGEPLRHGAAVIFAVGEPLGSGACSAPRAGGDNLPVGISTDADAGL